MSILKLDNIIIVGTSHVSRKSMNQISWVFENYLPKAVLVELDQTRFEHLMYETETSGFSLQLIKQLGLFTALLVSLLKFLQDFIGSRIGLKPGSEMKHAVTLAHIYQSEIYLIDQDIGKTLTDFKKIPWREKFSLFFSIFLFPFTSIFKRKKREAGHHNTESLRELLKEFKERYPKLYYYLVEKRNKVMARNILRIREKVEGSLLVVVGQGHVEGIINILERKLKKKSQIISSEFSLF